MHSVGSVNGGCACLVTIPIPSPVTIATQQAWVPLKWIKMQPSEAMNCSTSPPPPCLLNFTLSPPFPLHPDHAV